jgi:Zn-dependent metalloprotease
MSIVPPYVLDALERHASGRVRQAARRTRSTVVPRVGLPALAAQRAARRPHVRYRIVFDCRHEKKLPGVMVRRERQRNTGDVDADRAYHMAGETLDFYAAVFGRHSIDDRGMPVASTVHYGTRFQNALWNGAQMVYGDGDGIVFRSFTSCLEVAAHELTHGVTDAQASLSYDGQSGALCESISDVFGSLVKQRALRQTAAEADWLIGAGIFAPEIACAGLRSLAAPGTAYDDPLLGGRDPQPSHMRDLVETGTNDHFVHVNSGIPNHAFYLFATELGGHAWQIAGRVWYDALRSGLRRKCDFRAFARATLAAAAGHGPSTVEALRTAWRRVGITVAVARGVRTGR